MLSWLPRVLGVTVNQRVVGSSPTSGAIVIDLKQGDYSIKRSPYFISQNSGDSLVTD